MKKIERMPYSLVHITCEKNYSSIKKDGKINVSKHNLNKNKIQWLGDGIYFWSANDDSALAVGKNLVKGKYRVKRCVGIRIEVRVEQDKHMNLELKKWYDKYIEFVKKIAPEYYQKLDDYIQMIQSEVKVSTKDLNAIGSLTGTTINIFLNYLLSKHQIEIDLVSGYFYHGKSNQTIFSRNERTFRQFCIKNENLVNNCNDTWEIIHNI